MAKQKRRLKILKRRFCAPKSHFEKPNSRPFVNGLTFPALKVLIDIWAEDYLRFLLSWLPSV